MSMYNVFKFFNPNDFCCTCPNGLYVKNFIMHILLMHVSLNAKAYNCQYTNHSYFGSLNSFWGQEFLMQARGCVILILKYLTTKFKYALD